MKKQTTETDAAAIAGSRSYTQNFNQQSKNIKMKPVQVKLTRAEKRGRKIILVIESDLYSDEVFAVTPFYNEGDAKNQLQDVHFELKVTETSGKIKASVEFGNCLSHFTKGHTQLHYPVSKFFIDQKDCARDYFLKEKPEQFTDDRINQILKLWKEEPEFQAELSLIATVRKKQFKIDALNEAKEKYQKALSKLETALAELSL